MAVQNKHKITLWDELPTGKNDWKEIKRLRSSLQERKRQAFFVWALELAGCFILGIILGYLYSGGF